MTITTDLSFSLTQTRAFPRLPTCVQKRNISTPGQTRFNLALDPRALPPSRRIPLPTRLHSLLAPPLLHLPICTAQPFLTLHGQLLALLLDS